MARGRPGAEPGSTDEEVAFYDALAENESARQVMVDPALRVIAQELATSIKSNTGCTGKGLAPGCGFW